MSAFRRWLGRLAHLLYVGHYVSSACYHKEHGECRRLCQFCGDECACKCHSKGLPIIATGVTYP